MERFDELLSTFTQFFVRQLQKREDGNLRLVAQMCVDRGGERGHDEFVTAKSAEDRFSFQSGNQARFAGDDSGLRSAEQFVAAETDEIRAAFQRFFGRGFMLRETEFPGRDDRAAAEVLDQRNPFGARQSGELFD